MMSDLFLLLHTIISVGVVNCGKVNFSTKRCQLSIDLSLCVLTTADHRCPVSPVLLSGPLLQGTTTVLGVLKSKDAVRLPATKL